MKIIFLDIDGVLNNDATTARYSGTFIGIDPALVVQFYRILCGVPDAQVVLSSSWRIHPLDKEEVRREVGEFMDVTPVLGGHMARGREIAAWLKGHPEVKRYAILDDDRGMLKEQIPSCFFTNGRVGLTDAIVDQVIEWLND